MKLIACLIVLLSVFTCPAFAESAEALFESIDVSGAQLAADSANISIDVRQTVESFLSGEFEPNAESVITYAVNAIRGAVSDVLPDISAALFPILVWAFASRLMPSDSGGSSRVAEYACFLACALSPVRLFVGCLETCKAAVSSLSRLTDAFTPVLVSLLALTGGVKSASLITPMGALASRFLRILAGDATLALCSAGAALSIADCMGGVKLKRLAELTKAFAKWLLCAMLGAYLALMSTGGLISGAYDGVSVKTAKYLSGSLIPFVGGDISGTMESLWAGASLMRSAVGLTASAVMLAACIKPMLGAFACSILCRFIAAVTEPVGDGAMLSMLDSLSGAFKMLVAITACAAALSLILIGATIGLGARVFS